MQIMLHSHTGAQKASQIKTCKEVVYVLPGHIQSPLGILATISTFPY